MSQLERVEATRLRGGDVLYACETTCELAAVHAHEDRVQLVTNSRRFVVLPTTHFRRLIRSRRINMRPDLGTSTRGVRGAQGPEAITERISRGYRP